MKYFVLLLMVAIAACSNEHPPTEREEIEFRKTAVAFQYDYMGGSANCASILNAIDKNIQMSETRFGEPVMELTYEQLEEFCPHLPEKQVIKTVSEQRLLTTSLGYDYVSQLYLRITVGDTARETSSRIWQKKDGVWKIIMMNNSLNKACDSFGEEE